MTGLEAIWTNLGVLGPHAAWAVMLGLALRSNAAKDKIIADLSTKCIDMAQAANDAYAIAAQRNSGDVHA